MNRFLPTALATFALAASLTGCGTARGPLAAAVPTAAVRAADESDHQQMNAIVRSTLKEAFKALPTGSDGILTKAELAAGRSEALVTVFFKAFDGDADGQITAAEYEKALTANDEAVETFHHLAEELMSAAVKPFVADKDFDATDLRTYMTKELGLTVDFPKLFALMGKLDLNQDDKLLSAKGEGPAFMLTFARPTLQHALGIPTSLPEERLRKPAKR